MDTCPTCGGTLGTSAPGWCDGCGTGVRVGAPVLVDWLLPDAVRLDDEGVTPSDPLDWPGYADEHAAARERTGVDESVLSVAGRLAGTAVEVVAVAWDFGFFGGSMGVATGQRIAAAYDTARERGLPIVLLPSTGGARMQEGMAALVQMAATTVAATRHGAAGLLSVAVLRDPTTGGVFASHANLADVVLAEPGATIGFAGPRVAAAMTGGPLPEGSHTARGARAAGLVDDVVPRPDLPARLAAVCGWPGVAAPAPVLADDGPCNDVADPWTEVERARAPQRPRTAAFLAVTDVAAELHGDRAGADDPTIRVALARVAGRPAVVIGMDRARGGHTTPGGFRKSWRGLRLAARLGVPVVTLIDTPGADAGAASEAGGIAHHIARTFQEVLTTATPVVALVIGEGGSGGALALAVGDRLLMQEHAIFSVIAPEGAAAILHRDPARAPEVAALLDPTAPRLHALGIADEVVAEPGGAEVATAWAAVARHLDELAGSGGDELLAARGARWRGAGVVDIG